MPARYLSHLVPSHPRSHPASCVTQHTWRLYGCHYLLIAYKEVLVTVAGLQEFLSSGDHYCAQGGLLEDEAWTF